MAKKDSSPERLPAKTLIFFSSQIMGHSEYSLLPSVRWLFSLHRAGSLYLSPHDCGFWKHGVYSYQDSRGVPVLSAASPALWSLFRDICEFLCCFDVCNIATVVSCKNGVNQTVRITESERSDRLSGRHFFHISILGNWLKCSLVSKPRYFATVNLFWVTLSGRSSRPHHRNELTVKTCEKALQLLSKLKGIYVFNRDVVYVTTNRR